MNSIFSIYNINARRDERDDRTHPFVRNVGKLGEPWQTSAWQTRAGHERRVGFASGKWDGTFVYYMDMDPWTGIYMMNDGMDGWMGGWWCNE